MNETQDIVTAGAIATLAANYGNLVDSLKRIEQQMSGLATREELKQFLPRHEFDAFVAQATRDSPKSLFRAATEIALGSVAIITALGLLASLVVFLRGRVM